MASPTTEVHAFLASIGLEACAHAVVHNGFYTSMEALRGANLEELVDSGVRPAHAKLILSNLSANATAFDADLHDAPTSEVASFLRSVGLENCNNALAEAGYSTLDALGRATIQDLVSAGLKPVHARLIVSNLDTASRCAPSSRLPPRPAPNAPDAHHRSPSPPATVAALGST